VLLEISRWRGEPLRQPDDAPFGLGIRVFHCVHKRSYDRQAKAARVRRVRESLFRDVMAMLRIRHGKLPRFGPHRELHAKSTRWATALLASVSLRKSAVDAPEEARTGLGDYQLEIRDVLCLQGCTRSHDAGQKAAQAHVFSLTGNDK
jgi:hypothetical protein